MPCVSTALNVLNFIIVVKGGNAEILKHISITWTAPNYSAEISPGSHSCQTRATLPKTTPDLPVPPPHCWAGTGQLYWCHGSFCGSRQPPWRDQSRSARPKGAGSCCGRCVNGGQRTSEEESGRWRVPKWLQKIEGEMSSLLPSTWTFQKHLCARLRWSPSCQATKGLSEPNPN